MFDQIRRTAPLALLLVLLAACGRVPVAPGEVASPVPATTGAADPSTPADSGSAQPSTSPSTPGGSASAQASDTPSADPQTPSPQTPGPQTSKPSVPAAPAATTFQDSYVRDGVQVRVTRVKRTTLSDTAKAPGVDRGDPVQFLTVRVTNRGSAALDATHSRATMTYGAHGRTAPAVRAAGVTGLRGVLQPGQSTTATLGFAVPQSQLDHARLTLTVDSTRPPAVFSGSINYAPTNGTVFNDPTGSHARQLAITTHIERSIDAAPKGSTIRIAQYSFDIAKTADKLVAAHRRGVHIQMIVDQHDQVVTDETEQLIEALGEKRSRSSFLIRCGASCMSNRASTMHAKYYLFSAVGPARQVAMVSSANITHTNSQGSWNDLQTIVGDATLYGSLKQYFTDMAPDDNDRNYYRTTTSGPYKLYLFPRAAKHRVALLEALDGVSCSGAAAGYGTKDGHTVVRVMMYSWRGPRIDIAKKLWSLHDQGCSVEVILNSGRTDLAIKRVLTKKSDTHGEMKIRDAWVDKNGNNVAERYMHQKGITINGVWSAADVADNAKNPATKVVFSGSQNFAPLSTTDNNELILRHIDDATYDAYAKNFRYVVAHGTRRMW